MRKETLSLGKSRGLSQCADQDGIFNILALDHRQAIKKVFVESAEPYTEAVAFKRATVKALAPVSTAFLLDPSIGAGPSVADSSLPGACGLIVTVEVSGFAGPKHARVSRLSDDWGVNQIKRLGASAVKLLVYYHPKSETASQMKELVAQVHNECARLDIPLFLEILTYSPNPDDSQLDPEQRTDAVVQAASDLTSIGGDVLKVEFPVDVNAQADPATWDDACRSISQASEIPWVLLSAGVDFPVFAQQVESACMAGASGVLAGRAVWKEALGVSPDDRDIFLNTIARERMRELHSICRQYGRPYTEFFRYEQLLEDWYIGYR